MSRNGSGVYSLPAGNPVVTGTTISSSWANSTLSDIATALTGSVAADGQTAMTGNLQMGTNKITGLGVATTSGDALSFGQAATISALTVSGAFAANGGTTLGDASGDALTINSSAVSIPNGLNFDSNTFVIDATNNRVGVGTASPSQRLHVASAGTVAIQAENTASTGAAYLKSTNTATTCNFGVDATGGYIETLGAYSTLFYTNSAERMRIDSSGNVGIGTSSPITKLGINGGTSILGGNKLFLWNAANNSAPYLSSPTDNTIAFFDTSNSERMRIDTSGNLLVGNSTGSSPILLSTNSVQITNANAGQLVLRNSNSTTGYGWRIGPDSAGNNLVVFNQSGTGVYIVNGGTSWTGTSDERLKTDLTPINDAINKVSTLRAVTGRFKTDEEGVSRSFLIAQDVQAVLPEAVDIRDDEQGTLGIRYTDTIPLLVAAIKEQQALIQSQADTITAMESRLTALENK